MAKKDAADPEIETDRNRLLLRAGFPESALPKPGFEKRRLGAFDAYIGLRYLAVFGCWHHFRDLRGGEIYPADSAVALNNKRAMEWNNILFRAYDRQEMDDTATCYALLGVAVDEDAAEPRVAHYLYDPVPIRIFKKGRQYFFAAKEEGVRSG